MLNVRSLVLTHKRESEVGAERNSFRMGFSTIAHATKVAAVDDSNREGASFCGSAFEYSAGRTGKHFGATRKKPSIVQGGICSAFDQVSCECAHRGGR